MCLGEGVGSGSPDPLQISKISNFFKLNYEIPKNMPRTPPPPAANSNNRLTRSPAGHFFSVSAYGLMSNPVMHVYHVHSNVIV